MSRTLQDRILVNPKTQIHYIDLEESEFGLYTGSGERLARFQDGVLVELIGTEEGSKGIRKRALAQQGEVYRCFASCYQLCNPEPLIDPREQEWQDAKRALLDMRLERDLGKKRKSKNLVEK